MPAISTGTPGSAIVATCGVPKVGEFVTGEGLKTAIDPINDNLATIASGNHAFGGNKEFTGEVEFSGGLTGPLQTDSNVIATSFEYLPGLNVTRTGYSSPRSPDGAWIEGSNHWIYTGTTGQILRIPVDVPHAARVNTIKVWLDPASGHGGVPVVSFVLRRKLLSTGVVSAVASQYDLSASVSIYQAPHAVTMTISGGHTVDRSLYSYWIDLLGEQGGLALADLEYLGVEYGYTVFGPLGG